MRFWRFGPIFGNSCKPSLPGWASRLNPFRFYVWCCPKGVNKVPTRRICKYQIPEFLSSKLTQAQFEKWLRGRAAAHVKRDRKRGNTALTGED